MNRVDGGIFSIILKNYDNFLNWLLGINTIIIFFVFVNQDKFIIANDGGSVQLMWYLLIIGVFCLIFNTGLSIILKIYIFLTMTDYACLGAASNAMPFFLEKMKLLCDQEPTKQNLKKVKRANKDFNKISDMTERRADLIRKFLFWDGLYRNNKLPSIAAIFLANIIIFLIGILPILISIIYVLIYLSISKSL